MITITIMKKKKKRRLGGGYFKKKGGKFQVGTFQGGFTRGEFDWWKFS